MALAKQTISLLDAARDVVRSLPADALLLLTETDMDWNEVYAHLKGCRVLIAAENDELTDRLSENPDLDVINLDPESVPTRERMSLALLKAVNTGHLKPGAHVVVLYNGIANPEPARADRLDQPDPPGRAPGTAHPQDLRRLDTNIPLDILRLVINLATEIGRGREQAGQDDLVVGDLRRVQACRVRSTSPVQGVLEGGAGPEGQKVREWSEVRPTDGRSDRQRGVAAAACVSRTPGRPGSRRTGVRHPAPAAAAISRKTTPSPATSARRQAPSGVSR